MAIPIIDAIIASLALFLVLFFILMLSLGTLFLILGLGAVSGKDRTFGSTFVTVLIGTVLTLIPVLGCILYWYIIKTRHETGWGGAIAAWLIAGLIPLAIVFGVLIIMGIALL